MSGEKDSYNLSDDLRVAGVSRYDAEYVNSPELGDSEGESDDKLAYGTETILIVDDLQMNIDVTRDMLEYLGYQVISALSGKEAVDIYAVKKDRIDLVIQDMVMPGMDGAAVFTALKQINPQVKVILASAYGYNEKIKSVMQRGCRAFMPKPFSLEELSTKAREVLDSP